MTDNEPIRIGGFRSLLEFQWATVFEEMGLEYYYEPKKFTLPNEKEYIPDFYVKEFHAWVEIKPRKVTDYEKYKAKELSIITSQYPVVIFNHYPTLVSVFDCYINGEISKVHFNGTNLISDKDYQEKKKIIKLSGHNVELYKAFCSSSSGDDDLETRAKAAKICHEVKELFNEPYGRKQIKPYIAALTHNKKQGWHDYLDDAKC